jgi:hypothetical protein
MIPQARYAHSDGVPIAYQVLGTGPSDLVVVPGWVPNLEAAGEEPAVEHFCCRLGSFPRLSPPDTLGTGRSGRLADMAPFEVPMDDVLDAPPATRGLEVRAAAHTGECEVGDESGALALHNGARLAAPASPGGPQRYAVPH